MTQLRPPHVSTGSAVIRGLSLVLVALSIPPGRDRLMFEHTGKVHEDSGHAFM